MAQGLIVPGVPSFGSSRSALWYLINEVDPGDPVEGVGAMDFSNPDNSGLLALLEDI